ncbi:hypothetical protein EJF18_40089 [Clavispora lusitaniae]|uniref:Uncharacterized protein n=1 Tax=Clavispora lusitaniae TaxID=36911 RepID=A0ACD0WLL4_CLALS|nr:hypothetical protein EJF14_40089 [Clavispora lusitaniae]QFZ33729.1 hypothetical protein EJF16_40089 [Clavispora lusitaniae]QFZ39413.1 hypothetical protein EJF15_40089 [Clavispora lusitaniae]QFZ45095.1 hypothetical protein EJF18_40089 [Clavispora lusitaniae]QFZ50759.1 hypothetical protein EJF17_40089 [Clavispora lusitaniae]
MWNWVFLEMWFSTRRQAIWPMKMPVTC